MKGKTPNCFSLSFQGAARKLEDYPKSVEEFVEHLSFLSKMTSEITALDKEFLIVTKLFTIAKDFSVKIEPEDLALYQTLGPSFQGLKVRSSNILLSVNYRRILINSFTN